MAASARSKDMGRPGGGDVPEYVVCLYSQEHWTSEAGLLRHVPFTLVTS